MATESDYDELSEYSYEGTESVRTMDTVEEILSRFTLDCRPECALKLRNEAGSVVLGADLGYSITTKSPSVNLVVKPASRSALWRRLKVDSKGTLTLRMRKLSWWLFTLDLHGHANPLKRTTDLTFRVATKWDITAGEIRKKKIVPLTEGAEARVHWNINCNMPTIEGSLGTQQARGVHADFGYAHLSVPRAELVVWPKQLGKEPAAAEAEEEAEAAAPAATAGGGGSSSSKRGKGGWGGLAALSAALGQRGPLLPWQQAGGGSSSAARSRLGSIRFDAADLRAHIFQLAAAEEAA